MTRALKVLAATLIMLLAGCVTPPQAPETPLEPASPTTVVKEPKAPEPDPPQPPIIALRIAAVGDIMLGTDYPENHLPDDDGLGFLSGVSEFLLDADVTFGNLEGVLSDGGDAEKVCKNPSLCYLFRSPTRYAGHLEKAGFDVMSLANNHARDFGESGRSETMTALDARGIHHAGRENDVASWEVNGLKIALIAFSPNKESYSINDNEGGARLVAELAEKHDIVVVSFHGGAEGVEARHVPFGLETYYGERRGNLVAFSHAVIDAGADLVLGHGPHVTRAVEVYNDRLIAYSLGNFATYYGISVEGPKGVAPILIADLGPDGTFVSGRIISTHQVRPDGPSIDPDESALTEVTSLTRDDFGVAHILFDYDKRFFTREGLTRFRSLVMNRLVRIADESRIWIDSNTDRLFESDAFLDVYH